MGEIHIRSYSSISDSTGKKCRNHQARLRIICSLPHKENVKPVLLNYVLKLSKCITWQLVGAKYAWLRHQSSTKEFFRKPWPEQVKEGSAPKIRPQTVKHMMYINARLQVTSTYHNHAHQPPHWGPKSKS